MIGPLGQVAQGLTSGALRTVALAPYRTATKGVKRLVIKVMVIPTVGAFGAGVALGAALGVLLAPTSGRQLRAKLVSTFVRSK